MLDDLAKKVLLAAVAKEGTLHFMDSGYETAIAAGELKGSTMAPRERAEHRHCKAD